jgi:hypothetical protein
MAKINDIFDEYASQYDSEFSRTYLGKYYRTRVWKVFTYY